VKLFRGRETLELLKDPHAWTLLSVIAIRARRTSDFGISGLRQAEALLGDYENYGLTQQQYRSAKKKLQKWQIATFRSTPRGTIARLTGTEIYDINAEPADEQASNQATIGQQMSNEQPTTNKKEKKDKNERNIYTGQISSGRSFYEQACRRAEEMLKRAGRGFLADEQG
jgi:hypothetical protein